MSKLQEWQDAAAPAISGLMRLSEKRMAAAAFLLDMAVKGASVADSPEVAKVLGINASLDCDTTQYLKDTDLWLSWVNRVAATGGAKVILFKVRECRDGIENLKSLDEAFQGKGEWTEDQAWAYLRAVSDYLQTERENEIQMDRAGY